MGLLGVFMLLLGTLGMFHLYPEAKKYKQQRKSFFVWLAVTLIGMLLFTNAIREP